jgi:hypothetical protein
MFISRLSISQLINASVSSNVMENTSPHGENTQPQHKTLCTMAKPRRIQPAQTQRQDLLKPVGQ